MPQRYGFGAFGGQQNQALAGLPDNSLSMFVKSGAGMWVTSAVVSAGSIVYNVTDDQRFSRVRAVVVVGTVNVRDQVSVLLAPDPSRLPFVTRVLADTMAPINTPINLISPHAPALVEADQFITFAVGMIEIMGAGPSVQSDGFSIGTLSWTGRGVHTPVETMRLH